jgi:hypothetical protein
LAGQLVAWGREEVVQVSVRNISTKESLVRPRHKWEKVLKWVLEKSDGGVDGFIWVEIGTSGGPL